MPLCRFVQVSRPHLRREYTNRNREHPYHRQIYRDGKETRRDIQRCHSAVLVNVASGPLQCHTSRKQFIECFNEFWQLWSGESVAKVFELWTKEIRPDVTKMLVPDLFEHCRILLTKMTQRYVFHQKLRNAIKEAQTSSLGS